jgi:hypothetical protein
LKQTDLPPEKESSYNVSKFRHGLAPILGPIIRRLFQLF